jgi:hypothetical protein
METTHSRYGGKSSRLPEKGGRRKEKGGGRKQKLEGGGGIKIAIVIERLTSLSARKPRLTTDKNDEPDSDEIKPLTGAHEGMIPHKKS